MYNLGGARLFQNIKKVENSARRKVCEAVVEKRLNGSPKDKRHSAREDATSIHNQRDGESETLKVAI